MNRDKPDLEDFHPFKLRLAPTYQYMTLEELKKLKTDPNFQHDDRFVKLYAEYMAGRRVTNLTRLRLSQIDVGVRRRRQDGSIEWIANAVDEQAVKASFISLRKGVRPTLSLYRGQDGRFVCPDDAVSANAYRLAGIQLVPCQLLEDPGEFPDGALSIKTYPPLNGGVLVGLKARSVSSSLIAKRLDGADPVAAIGQLVEWAHEAAAKVREFHASTDETGTHWHHVLVSVAERVASAVGAIKLLLEAHAVLEAASIVRVIYEMALTFHLNWLAPQFTGHYLQAIADVGPNGWKKVVEALEADIPPGVHKQIHQPWVEGHRRLGQLCSSPNEKAVLCPVGLMHGDIYPALSGIAHQDFGALASYAARLDDPTAPPNDSINVRALLSITNIGVSSILFQILNDVGVAQTVV